MIWTKEAIDDFIGRVAPPGEVLRGFDDRILFDDMLAVALDKWPGADEDNTPLLEALREKYPEAVEAHMQEAENMMKEAMRA